MTLGPQPILDAVDSYRGTIFDLDRQLSIDQPALQQARFQICQELEIQGMGPGDRIVLAVGNGPLFIASLAAILTGGGSPLLVHSLTPDAELRRISMRFGARLILSNSCDASTTGDIGSLAKPIGDPQSWVQLAITEVDRRDPSFDDRYPSLPGIPLHPTSGTTGQPKLAVRPAERAVAEAAHYVETIGIDDRDTLLAAAPMSHAYAFGMCVMVPLITSANIVTMRRFAAKLVFGALAEQKISVLPAVPAMLDVLTFAAGDRLRQPGLRVLSAGAPLPARTAKRFQQLSGITVCPLYGTTETGGISVASAEQGALGTSVGPAMAGVSVRVDASKSSDFPAGVGRLLVKSSSMMTGYLSHEGLDTSPLFDGWFTTGDLARLDPDGTIHLVGRETEVINVGGMKVIPSEVEEVIAALPAVHEVKVYAGKERSGAQLVKAAVVGASHINRAIIEAHCQQQLIYFKQPQIISILDSLPRSPAGKIILDQLP